MDLVRAILLAIEASPTGRAPHPLAVDGYPYDHAHLLKQADLITAITFPLDNDGEGPQAIPTGLTWAGHEFLDAARDDTIWRKALNTAKTAAGGATVAVLQQLLAREVRAKLGLPQ